MNNSPRKKRSLPELAVFGGTATFNHPRCVNTPNFGEEEVLHKHVSAIVQRRWFTNDGPLVQQLEEELETYLQVKHCVVACNGTAAMAMAIIALGLKGEVILPSFSFISTAHLLSLHGLVPVFCDIDPVSWNTDPEHCEKLITENTSAIIATHLWGRACDIHALQELADKRNINLLFDAAHAFGSEYQGKKIGNFGDAEVFSFHATKVFHTSEGGAITTNDPDLAQRLKAVRNFGFSGYDQVDGIGMNAKMPEICAAMGLTNLKSLQKFYNRNEKNYYAYREGLKNIPGVYLQEYNPITDKNFQYIVVDIDEKETGINRDDIVTILHVENVIARRYFYPGCHQSAPYQKKKLDKIHALPFTEDINQRVLLLPNGSDISELQVDNVCDLLHFIIINAADITHALGNKC
ncbi:MAG: dTDP-4-amino-4,6-dideoxygalactose transaminase [Arenicella sp.]|jgi:dTDP-4-amino-4,6-dideoxygalactose transaminase